MKRPRSKWLIAIILGLVGLYGIGFGLRQSGYGISYQESASMPEGWYVLTPLHLPINRNTIVVFEPNPGTERYLLDHAWLRPRTLLMKKVFALPGDEVCIKNQVVWINQQPTVKVLADYAPDKPLPQLRFCRKLNENEYWLMSDRIAKSFDSRYFGPVEIKNILNQAKPL